jgi:hypothetical protein
VAPRSAPRDPDSHSPSNSWDSPLARC